MSNSSKNRTLALGTQTPKLVFHLEGADFQAHDNPEDELDACDAPFTYESNTSPLPGKTYGGRALIPDLALEIPHENIPVTLEAGVSSDASKSETDLQLFQYESLGVVYECYLISPDDIGISSCYTASESLVVPAEIKNHTVRVLGAHVFSECKNLQSLILPDSVETIQNFAFFGTRLTSIHLPGHLKIIGDKSFYRVKTLEQIQLPSSLQYIGASAFLGSGIQSLHIPAGVSYIGRDAFDETLLSNECMTDRLSVDQNNPSYFYDPQGCLYYKSPQGLVMVQLVQKCQTNLTINPKTRYIADRALVRCKNVESVRLPEGLEIIGANAFEDCSRLSSINFPSTLKRIGSMAFCGTNIQQVRLPASLTEMGECALYTGILGRADNIPTIRSLVVDASNPVYYMHTGVLFERRPDGNSCALLYVGPQQEVVLGSEVSSIGPHAFSQVTTVKRIEISDSIHTIGLCGLSIESGVETLVFHQISRGENITYTVRFAESAKPSNAFKNAFRKGKIDISYVYRCADASLVMGDNLYICSRAMAERLMNPVYLSKSYKDLFQRALERKISQVSAEFALHRFLEGYGILADLGFLNACNITGLIEEASERGEVEAANCLLRMKNQRFGTDGFALDFSI